MDGVRLSVTALFGNQPLLGHTSALATVRKLNAIYVPGNKKTTGNSTQIRPPKDCPSMAGAGRA
jgi:hypothetical protein